MKGNDLNMYETKVKIDGMMCGMCESHINDAIRNAFSVKKVSASHSKGEADIISEEPIDEAKLREAGAFDVVIVGDAGEIAGEGFKPVRSDDRTLGEIIKAIRKTGDKPVSEPKE